MDTCQDINTVNLTVAATPELANVGKLIRMTRSNALEQELNIFSPISGTALIPAVFSHALLLNAPDANAYLDPGTGSLALQLLIGGLATIVAGFYSYRDRLLSWLRSRSKTKSDSCVEDDGQR